MANWEEGLRKVILAGVGAAAATAEKGQELLHELVQKGESTVEEGSMTREQRDALRQRLAELDQDAPADAPDSPDGNE